ncbi:MAG: hypothetical protein KBA31_19525 [Alphaproteobacteria bacterium]|nr:hypothetical protein [Alphaproteobacteria bacterium]
MLSDGDAALLGDDDVRDLSEFSVDGRYIIGQFGGAHFVWDVANKALAARDSVYPSPDFVLSNPCRSLRSQRPSDYGAHNIAYVDCASGKAGKVGSEMPSQSAIARVDEQCGRGLVFARKKNVRVGEEWVPVFEKARLWVFDTSTLKMLPDLTSLFRARIVGSAIVSRGGRCVAYALVQGGATGRLLDGVVREYTPVEIDEVDLGNRTRKMVGRLVPLGQRVALVARDQVEVSPDGRYLALVTVRSDDWRWGEKTLAPEIFDLQMGQTVREFPGPIRSVLPFVWLDGHRIAYVVGDRIKVGDIRSGALSDVEIPKSISCNGKACKVLGLRFSRATGMLAIWLEDSVLFAQVAALPE